MLTFLEHIWDVLKGEWVKQCDSHIPSFLGSQYIVTFIVYMSPIKWIHGLYYPVSIKLTFSNGPKWVKIISALKDFDKQRIKKNTVLQAQPNKEMGELTFLLLVKKNSLPVTFLGKRSNHLTWADRASAKNTEIIKKILLNGFKTILFLVYNVHVYWVIRWIFVPIIRWAIMIRRHLEHDDNLHKILGHVQAVWCTIWD